jgi:hypothetical protein
LASASRSRNPANNTITKVNPSAEPMPYNKLSMNPYYCCTLSNAMPNTAQLVVINGRKMPKT